MKRKNILKFVSLLGIGSFVMLAAASCTKTTTKTPNPNTPSNGGGMTNDVPGGNTNPGGGEGTNNDAQELANAKKVLSDLLTTQNNNVVMYTDYAKIQDTLTKAYGAARAVLDNSASTTQNLNDAKTKLEAAINAAATGKQNFDQKNAELVKVYKKLKATLSSETVTLAPYTEAQFAGIKMHLSALYDTGKELISKTLDPVDGVLLTTEAVMQANTNIVEAIKEDVLNLQKENANKLAQSFVKRVLVKDEITGTTSNNQQPGNYSFVGYSVDVTGAAADGQQNTIPNWNYAHRTIFTTNDNPISNTTDGEAVTQPLSNISWIYSLAGEGVKYTLNFDYYGPSTGYLYFPYKLVKDADKDNIALQYKLNDANQLTPITFGEGKNFNGKAPTVSDINVAKVTLANLKFGSNKIEFSVPDSKVNPMIGNMYLSSSPNNWNEVYDDIFGNSVGTTRNNNIKISVDTLSGYSLAADWSTAIYEYGGEGITFHDSSLSADKKYYLIGYVGGNANRPTDNKNLERVQKSPSQTGNDNRNYTFYVNAPKEGNYYIKGIFTGNSNSKLKFTTGNHSLTIMNLMSKHNELKIFDTSVTTGSTEVVNTADSKKTLTLAKGLNRIVVGGSDNDSVPNFGHLEFILNETQSAAATPAENSSR